jgi:aerobic-type carbon monoxide dehydrogenase small subunit (CoxS/CutS family)
VTCFQADLRLKEAARSLKIVAEKPTKNSAIPAKFFPRSGRAVYSLAIRRDSSNNGCLEQEFSMSDVTLRVNGKTHTVDIDPSTPLLYILRNDIGLQGPRFGCGLGQCGACTVIIDGVATRSCITTAGNVKSEVTTLEGLAKDGVLHPLQQAWIAEQVPQCGFCQNGQIMTAKAMLDRNPNPTDAEIREGMAGALCRCMTYYRIQAAIKRVAGRPLNEPALRAPQTTEAV